ncbi:SPOR domain-containing protein [Alteromonas sp. CYL-A6]|uniref:SPOR domain-containing protein n=1 Tax=Alteromonas nitratireducens TaxID=3390813 RepID=UPI0034A97EDC
MHNDLHDRLDYLVNYSSQLIFVSGDSIAHQQRTLETFVFQQHDDTEIAYLTADDTMTMSDYRRQLCRQLLGQVVGSYVRPLNELLADLNAHDGPILIAITQAQFIPDTLLQELWDLVLQSRFAGNKQHLNVLLFGETKWAERAKQWLPAKNTDTPLLISSQSVNAGREQSDLDRMISQRREAFQAHLAARHQQQHRLPSNVLRSPWFISLIVLAFIGIFAAMVGWQYGDQLRQLFSPIETTPVVTNTTEAKPGTAYAEIVAAPEPATPTEPEVTADPLVTTWNDAIANQQAADTPDPGQGTAQPDDAAPAAGITDTTELNDTATAVASQPDTSLVTKQPQPVQPAEAKVSDSAAQPTPANDNAALLSAVRPSDYFLQLAGLSDTTLLQQFLRDNKLTSLTKVYQTQRYGGAWFVVLFATPYPSVDDAKAAIATLPAFNGKANVFVKRGDQILKELNAARLP